EAEHQTLIAGATGIHSLSDVGRLFVNRRKHGAGFGVEAKLAPGVADLGDSLTDDILNVDASAGRDLSRDDDEACRDECFAGHAAERILREDRVENGIRDLI